MKKLALVVFITPLFLSAQTLKIKHRTGKVVKEFEPGKSISMEFIDTIYLVQKNDVVTYPLKFETQATIDSINSNYITLKSP